ncbi:insulinase family protein [Azoarcus sp. L1K30]|nr:insulinase family protein [Azoarcus sp. L1K30]
MTANLYTCAGSTHLPPKFALAAGLFMLSIAAHAGPHIEQWTASTGARVQFVESRALPLVDIQIDFTAGSAVEPGDKTGLAALTRGLLDAGAGTMDEQAISDRTADIGAQIGGSTDNDRSNLSIRSLSSATELDAAVDLAATLLSAPTFPQAVLDRERERAIAGLREALTKPDRLASRRFNEIVYSGHPYGRNTTADTLASITREDLVTFHRDYYAASHASVSIVGDIDRADAERIAVRLTSQLPQGVDLPHLTAPALPTAQTVHIPHPSAQAHILIGQPGMAREDADYFPLLVGNYLLGGGGFVSRLTREVREKRGFAYSVYSYFAPQKVAGPFEIGLQTRGSQSAEALKVVNDTLAAFIAEGPSMRELQAAKDNLVNGFGLRLDSNRKILDYVAMIGFYRLPLDWLDRYPQAVAAVTVDQVRDAFARRISPAHMVTVIAGGDGDAGATADPTEPAR